MAASRRSRSTPVSASPSQRSWQHSIRWRDPFDEQAAPTHVTASAIVTGETAWCCTCTSGCRCGCNQVGTSIPGKHRGRPHGARRARRRGCPSSPVRQPDRLLHVDVHPGPRGHTHLDVRYHFTSPSVVPTPPAGESPDVRWFPWSQAIAIAEPGLEGVLRANQPGQPVDPSGGRRRCRGVRPCLRALEGVRSARGTRAAHRGEIAAWIADVAIPDDGCVGR